MDAHFRNREHPLWTHPAEMSPGDRQLAADLVRSSPVQGAIDHLENLLPPEQRFFVACSIAIVAEPIVRNVVIELRGTSAYLGQIRDRVSPELTVVMPDHSYPDLHLLQVPMAMINGFG